MLPPIGGTPTRKQPQCLDEIPARLEGCRQRLAAADRAVSWVAARGGSVGSVGKYGQEAEIDLLQRQLDEVCKEDRNLIYPEEALLLGKKRFVGAAQQRWLSLR